MRSIFDVFMFNDDLIQVAKYIWDIYVVLILCSPFTVVVVAAVAATVKK